MKTLFVTIVVCAVSALAQEEKALGILGSDAPLKDKLDACRELARIGTARSVPVLAPLLTDEALSHMARYALEQIPDESANVALRESLPKVKGRLLIGVIHSIGVRKDVGAVGSLERLLSDPDSGVVEAAARALGNIGAPALSALDRALSSETVANKQGLLEGLLRCAEQLPAPDAVKVYEKIRLLPEAPHHIRVAALRGIARCRGGEAVPLLVEAARTESYVSAGDAIQTLLEISAKEGIDVLIKEITGLKLDTQVLLVQAIGRLGDRNLTGCLLNLAQDGPVQLRVAAIHSLVQLGDSAVTPVLYELAKDPEPQVSNAALAGLAGMTVKEADTALLALLAESNPKLRVAAIDVLTQRRATSAFPALFKAAADPDARVAGAAFQALGELAEADQIPAIGDLLLQAKAVTAAEKALTAICSRQPDRTACVDRLLELLGKADGEPKLALLRVLGAVGGDKALAAVRAATQDPNNTVRETALRVMCDWQTPEALPDLAQLAKTPPDEKFKILALQAQLRLIPAQGVSAEEKVAHLKGLMPALQRLEEKRLAIAVLGGLPTPLSLAMVGRFLGMEGLNEEASDAAVTLAENLAKEHPAEVAPVLRMIRTNNKKLTERAQALLSAAEATLDQQGFNRIFNGKDLAGWDGKPGWWKVEDGALTSESTPEKPCDRANYLIWRGGQPSDFELLVEFKLSLDGNSGIQIRSEERPDYDTFGYQADMTGNGELIGFIYHHSRGLVAGRGEKVVFDANGTRSVERIGDAAELLTYFRPGDWNSYRIVCRGSDITLYLNGVLMCQVTDRSPQAAPRGIIALQMHPGPPMKVQFRNLRLRVFDGAQLR